MLAAEATALLFLRRKLRSDLAPEPSKPEALDIITRLIWTVRQNARDAGRERLQRELRTIVAAAPEGRGYDMARARMVAEGYRAALFSQAERVGSLEMAALATDSRAATIAATETAHAFSRERDQAARILAREQGLSLWKVWDAVLDKRTCPRCSGLHGTAVPVAESFPAGQPGGLHPRCRCVATIVSLDDIAFQRKAS